METLFFCSLVRSIHRGIRCTAQVYEFILVRLWTHIGVYISGLQLLNRWISLILFP